ncbi:MAG: endonuclease/exonuclease/phosphatase family protein [Chlorobium sp.]
MVKKKFTAKEVMRKLLCCYFSLFIAASWIYPSATGRQKPEKTVLFMWWNVENLFDTHNDAQTDDDDFTPSGKLQWTEKKLLLKQMRIRHVITAVQAHPDYRKYPDILAFAEVENQSIFEETLSGIQGITYKSIYYESPDPRGIDVALAYNPKTLHAEASKAYTLPLAGRGTRKIIVAGFSAESHLFHLILNHWPSRSFDTAWTEPKRVAAATVARHILDSLLVGNPKADIVVMGDFNDETSNNSLQQVLGSTFDADSVKRENGKLLFNCWGGYEGIGSYLFNNHWQQIDHILLTGGMFDRTGLQASKESFRCFWFPPMLDDNGKKPYATFEKRKYKGGYSDHLPLILRTLIAN